MLKTGASAHPGNQIARLDEAETTFLTEVAMDKQRVERERRRDEEKQLRAFRARAMSVELDQTAQGGAFLLFIV